MENENTGAEDDGNTFKPPDAPVLKRLESTEYFEGCSDPEMVFGANLSNIMASFALKSNDDINLADLATPKGRPVRVDSSLKIESLHEESFYINNDARQSFGSPRRHSSINLTHSSDAFMFEQDISPPGFAANKRNELGGANNFTVPDSMIGQNTRYSYTTGKRRTTLDRVDSSAFLKSFESNTNTSFRINMETSEWQNDIETPSEGDFQHQVTSHLQQVDDSEQANFRRGSRRHSSPPRRNSLGNQVYQQIYDNDNADSPKSSHMDINAKPFQPSSPMLQNFMYQGSKSPPPRSNYTGSPRAPSVAEHHRPGKVKRYQPGSSDRANPLQQFKSTSEEPTVDVLVQNILHFARDSQGSRFLQQKMETATVDERVLLVEGIRNHIVELSCHPFGNYVVQNFFKHATKSQMVLMTHQFFGSIKKISNDTHGCRAIQFALEIVSLPLRNKLINEVCDFIGAISKNSHGTHVVQKCLGYLTTETINVPQENLKKQNELCLANNAPTTLSLLEKVEDKILKDFLRLAVHPYSYRLIQFTLADCNARRSEGVKKILEKVKENYQPLALDQHGNFILQHILDNGSPEQIIDVQKFVCSKVLMLSQQKFGSHLVEKCLTTATSDQVSSVINQILRPTDQNKLYLSTKVTGFEESALMLLCKDPYANFVVQKAYKFAPPKYKSMLGKEISKRSDMLTRFTYGRHILAKVNQ